MAHTAEELAELDSISRQIKDNPAGGVTLQVLESGFSALSDDPAVWLEEREGNDNGWAMELEVAKTYAEARA